MCNVKSQTLESICFRHIDRICKGLGNRNIPVIVIFCKNIHTIGQQI